MLHFSVVCHLFIFMCMQLVMCVSLVRSMYRFYWSSSSDNCIASQMLLNQQLLATVYECVCDCMSIYMCVLMCACALYTGIFRMSTVSNTPSAVHTVTQVKFITSTLNVVQPNCTNALTKGSSIGCCSSTIGTTNFSAHHISICAFECTCLMLCAQ